MDDSFRLDLENCDKNYIVEVLDGFREYAPSYGRKLLEIRVSQAIFNELALDVTVAGCFFKGIPVVIVATPFENTIEVIIGHPQ